MTAALENEALEELALYIRQTLPQPRAIQKLEMMHKLEAVRFHWQGREFLVRKNMDVLELKGGENLYVTGTSILIQNVLTKRSKNEKVLNAIEEILKEAEEMINSKFKADAGLKLLETAKTSLIKLLGNKSNSVLRRAA
jgi:hypothetical protein